VAQVLECITDTTDTKNLERTLREKEHYLQSVLDASNDAIFVNDAETGRFIDVNRAMCDMYGYTREEALRALRGRPEPGSAAVFPERPWSGCAGRAKPGRRPSPGWPGEKNGSLFWAEVSIRFTVLGGANRFVVMVRDTTQRKQAEEALAQTNEELQASIEELRPSTRSSSPPKRPCAPARACTTTS
jgi:PAS domain-containing protein